VPDDHYRRVALRPAVIAVVEALTVRVANHVGDLAHGDRVGQTEVAHVKPAGRTP
jgi:hypothetical protein